MSSFKATAQAADSATPGSSTRSYAEMLRAPSAPKSTLPNVKPKATTMAFKKQLKKPSPVTEPKPSPVTEPKDQAKGTAENVVDHSHWSKCGGTFTLNGWKRVSHDFEPYVHSYEILMYHCHDENTTEVFDIKSGDWQPIMTNDPQNDVLFARIAQPSSKSSIRLDAATVHSKAWDFLDELPYSREYDSSASFTFEGVEFSFKPRWEVRGAQWRLPCYALQFYSERFEEEINPLIRTGFVRCELTGKYHAIPPREETKP